MSLNIEIVSGLNYTEISKIISEVLFDQFIFIKMFFLKINKLLRPYCTCSSEGIVLKAPGIISRTICRESGPAFSS